MTMIIDVVFICENEPFSCSTEEEERAKKAKKGEIKAFFVDYLM